MTATSRMEVKSREKGKGGWFFACKEHQALVTTTARGRKGWQAMWAAMEDHVAEDHARERDRALLIRYAKTLAEGINRTYGIRVPIRPHHSLRDPGEPA